MSLIECPVVRLAGLEFAALSEPEVVQLVLGELRRGQGGWIVTPNLDILRQLVRNEETRSLVADASMFVADGMPLVWASRLQGTALPDRVTGSNLITSVSRMAATEGRSVYLLGGDDGTAEAAASVLCKRFSRLRIAGTYCPPNGFEHDQDERDRIRNLLTVTAPDIVYVALGFPKQERLICLLKGQLPHAWWIGVGISFSYLCGRVPRAPVWMQRVGLEWMYRLWQEPGRLMRRYLVDDIPFGIWLMARTMVRRIQTSTRGVSTIGSTISQTTEVEERRREVPPGR